jgi:hypothetical protein
MQLDNNLIPLKYINIKHLQICLLHEPFTKNQQHKIYLTTDLLTLRTFYHNNYKNSRGQNFKKFEFFFDFFYFFI